MIVDDLRPLDRYDAAGLAVIIGLVVFDVVLVTLFIRLAVAVW